MANLNHESLLEEVQRLLPAPIRDDVLIEPGIALVGGDPGEVIVQIRDEKVSISVYSAGWEGPYTPVVLPERIATLNWKRLPASTTKELLRELINAAIELRRATYRKCEKCRETKPPEWMHNDNICQSCAEQQLGVVH